MQALPRLFEHLLIQHSTTPNHKSLQIPQKILLFCSKKWSIHAKQVKSHGSMTEVCDYKFKQKQLAMQHQYKSPLKVASKSTNKHSKSVTLGKRSKYKQQSESKSHAARVKEIADRQPYKNILNRLLRSQNFPKFVKEAEKYVELTEEVAAPFKSKSMENEHSRRQFHQYGRALLKDGSFIRYYCKLAECMFQEDRKSIREMFYEKYRHQVCLRQKMFHDYFKEEVQPNQDPHLFSFSKSKLKQKKNPQGQSSHQSFEEQRSRSMHKAKTQASFCFKEIDKGIDNLTAIEHVDSSNSFLTKDSKEPSENEVSQKEIPKSEKKSKIVHFEKETEDEGAYDEEDYRSPYLKYKPRATEEEEKKQSKSNIKKTRLKSSEKRKSIIVKFSDEIKSDQRLREIYEQLLKEKEERDKQLQSQNSTKNSNKQTIVRSCVNLPNMDFLEVRLRVLTPGDLSKMTPVQKEIIAIYPTIHMIADERGIQISASQVQGHFKGYIIHKAVITDINHYLEPDYIGIVAEQIKGEVKNDIKPCTFEPDDRIEIILFK